jgi:hypothetical protein
MKQLKKKVDKDSQKTDKTKKRECLYNMIKSTTLAVISFPFSKKRSLNFREEAQTYISTLHLINKTVKLKREIKEKKQKNKRNSRDLEQKEAEISSKFQQMGYNEDISNYIALNPEKYVYITLDFLKEQYKGD